MIGIDKIVIRNFKAFPKEDVIDVGGKHMLVYGENGSGKSSIYWALYTLFQATTRDVDQTRKYFTRINPEHLLNIFTDNEDSFIKISLSDEPQVFYKLDVRGLSMEGTSTRTTAILSGLNNASDFIGHRLLVGFYNFRNRYRINLWRVFERDVLPFLKTERGQGSSTLGRLYQEIFDQRPFRLLRNGKIERQIATDTYNRKIDNFNSQLDYWLTEINLSVNQFYQDNFHINGEEELHIILKYEESDRLAFGPVKQIRRVGTSEYTHESKDQDDLTDPHIDLELKVKKHNGEWKPVNRPQSYFNEARLTSIALAIRFSLLEDTIRPANPGRSIVLDDLLISMDMNNRDRVLDVILKKYVQNDSYKVYLFTHDRAFFEMAKNRIRFNDEYNEDDWKFYEVYSVKNPEFDHLPKIYESKDHIARAYQHLNQTLDYPAAVNYLRKAAEQLVHKTFPVKALKNDDGSEKPTFDAILTAALAFYQRFSFPSGITKLNRLKEFVPLLLNPLSHKSDISSPAYRIEVKAALSLIEELRIELGAFEFVEILSRGQKLDLVIDLDPTTKKHHLVTLKDDLFKAVVSGTSARTKCQIEKSINCYEIKTGNTTKLNEAPREISAPQANELEDFYNGVCVHLSKQILPNYLDFFYDPNSRQLSSLI